ncbi:MAG: hypothetical protein ACTSVI_10945, partial [Promethearchaeota archaeon]
MNDKVRKNKKAALVSSIIFFILSIISLVASITLFFMDHDEYSIYIAALPLISIIFPLGHLARVNKRLEITFLRIMMSYMMGATILTVIFIIIIGDFLIFSIVFYLVTIFWIGAICALSERAFKAIKEFSRIFARISAIMLITYLSIVYIFNPLKAIDLGILPAIDGVADMLVGLIFIGIVLISFFTSHLRANTYLGFAIFVIWFLNPIEWFSRNFRIFFQDYAGTTIFIISFSIMLLLNAGIAAGWSARATAILRKQKRSVFWGPVTNNFLGIFRTEKRRQMVQELKKLPVNKAFTILLIVAIMSLPGVLIFTKTVPIPVKITPKNYNVTYNFWASERINESYTPEEKQELNEHHVNLDITIYLTRSKMPILVDFENQMPNITYRVTVIPANISDLYPQVVRLTELLMEYEANGTIDQWKGFVFDIEGHAYAWYGNGGSFQDSIDTWNKVFDYIEQKSIERGKVIEMECVNAAEFSVDGIFDGDLDMQKIEGYNSYIPERFTTYAPMVYRCWPSGKPPYGSQKTSLDFWKTSYYVYTQLYTLKAGVPYNKLGVYLGITNTSCYGRDIIQNDQSTYRDGTGLGNLKRDILIAKHFGIKEV